jgi:hypothetical protein
MVAPVKPTVPGVSEGSGSRPRPPYAELPAFSTVLPVTLDRWATVAPVTGCER